MKLRRFSVFFAVSRAISFLSASQPIAGMYSQPFSWLLASSFEVYRSHNDAPQSVGLLRTSDQFAAETST